MTINLKSGIAASVIAITIATAGITTVSSFTLVPEAQAWSLKSAAKKTWKHGKKQVRNQRRLHDTIVPSELRYPTRKIKQGVKKVTKWRPKPVTLKKKKPHDHRTPGLKRRVVRR